MPFKSLLLKSMENSKIYQIEIPTMTSNIVQFTLESQMIGAKEDQKETETPQ